MLTYNEHILARVSACDDMLITCSDVELVSVTKLDIVKIVMIFA